MCQYAKQAITEGEYEVLTNLNFTAGKPDRDLLFYDLLDKSDLLHWEIDPDQLCLLFDHILIERPSIGSLPAGYTYIGQLLTHDIVQDSDIDRAKNSPRGHPATPFLNLDSIYFSESHLKDNPELMLDGSFITRKISGASFDLNRSECGTAKIPDPRNDDNVIVAQLLVKIQEFHNAILNTLSEGTTSEKYNYCRAFVTLLFQRIIVEDYLQKTLHPSIYEAYFIQNKNVFADNRKDCDFVIPLEYSHAAFRFGHSMVRHAYVLDGADEQDLSFVLQSGQKIGPDKKIDWSNFFPLGEKTPQPALKINLELASNFFAEQKDNRNYHAMLPSGHRLREHFPEEQEEKYREHFRNIAYSDLTASQKVPSARDIVRSLEYSNFHPAYRFFQDLCLPSFGDYMRLVDFGEKFKENVAKGDLFNIYACPLWLFLLREAEVFPFSEKTRAVEFKETVMTKQIVAGMEAQDIERRTGTKQTPIKAIAHPPCDHQRLGPIGSIIVAETLRESISRADINIYKSWSDINEALGCELSSYYAQLLSEHRFLDFTFIIKFLEKSINKEVLP